MLPIKNLTSLFLLTDRNVRVFLVLLRRNISRRNHTPRVFHARCKKFGSMLKQKRQLVEKTFFKSRFTFKRRRQQQRRWRWRRQRRLKSLNVGEQKFGANFTKIRSSFFGDNFGTAANENRICYFFSFSTKIFRRCVVNEVVQLAGAALHSSEVTFLLLSQWKII